MLLRLRTAYERARREDGFSLVEAMVALGIFAVALLALATVAVSGLKDVGLSRQRQGATGIANALMEQVRGLAIPSELALGLSQNDPAFAADPNIVGPCSDGRYRYKSCTAPSASSPSATPSPSPIGEVILSTPAGSGSAPLVPHMCQRRVLDELTTCQGSTSASNTERTTYTRRVYVTRAALPGMPASGAFRVVVQVSWSAPMRTGASDTVEVQSLVYQPEGCVSGPQNNPFAAPCTPYFYGSGTAPQSLVQVAGRLDGNAFSLSLAGASGRSDMQLEQLGRVQTSSVPSAVSMTSGGTTSAAQGTAASAVADDDPATSTSTYQTSDLGSGATGTLQHTGSGRQIEASADFSSGSPDSGSAASAMAAGQVLPAGGSQVCPLTVTSSLTGEPAPQTDGLPCGYSRHRAGGTQRARLVFTSPVGGLPVGSAPLATVSPPAAPTWVLADRGSSTPDGTITTRAVRSVGALEVGGVPSTLTVPSGWLGYFIRVEPHTASVSASAGSASTAPSASFGTGAEVKVWNGLGYATMSLASAFNLPSCPALPVDPLAQCMAPLTVGSPALVEVTITPSSVTGGGTSVTQVPSLSGSGLRTEATATANAPLTAAFNYRVVVSGVTVADADFTINAGALDARAGYRAAPNA